MFSFRQSTGELFAANGFLVGRGWAGQGAGKNNPVMENVPGIGPLPRGGYTIEEPHDDARTGPYTMNLVPDAINEMFGRSEFRIHGAALEHPELSSEGCIVLPHDVRQIVWDSGDHRLQVT
jgi:hypothetical protein